MSAPLILALPGDDAAARTIASAAGGELGQLELREFPDGEQHVRIATPCSGRQVWVVGSLHQPGRTLLPAYFVAATARDLGALEVGLAAPYLAYLRQDARFGPGEGVTSRYVARLWADVIDRLVTVDPHLHRYRSLTEVFAMPSRLVAAAPRIARWLAGRYDRPVVVGPDDESRQWAAAVAEAVGCPHVILAKTRRGDRDVSISPVPGGIDWPAVTPVVVDDIVSTARTMIEAVGELRRAGAPAPVCVAIHPVFVPGAEADLRAAGVREIASTNTIAHPSNAIEVLDLVGQAVRGPW